MRWCDLRIPDNERNANAWFMHRPLINHSVLTVEQAVVTHEDNDRVIELSARLQGLIKAANAVIDGKDRPPVGSRHRCEIFDSGRAIVRKILSPLKEWAIDAVPCWQTLFDPGRFAFELKRSLRIPHIDVVEGVLVFLFGKVEAVWSLVAQHHQPRF